MSQKESFDGAVKDNYFDGLVRFDRRDDLIELRNGVRSENIERRMVNGYSPIVGRAPRKMHLLPHLRFGSHILSPMNFYRLLKALTATGKASGHSSPHVYLATSKMISNSTGAPSGRLATP